ARRKFMRSEATENYHIASIVTHYALARPEIAFTLTSNGREVLRVSPAKDLRERSFQIFGSQILDSLLPVSGGREYVARVTGFISAPRERRTNRDSQYFFVNNRFVRDKTIAGGLLEGYRSVLPHGIYPVAFLFLDVPPEEIDVNVHPAKTEIRFRRNEAVKDVIAEAIREALAKAGIVAAEAENLGTPIAMSAGMTPTPHGETFAQNRIEFGISGVQQEVPQTIAELRTPLADHAVADEASRPASGESRESVQEDKLALFSEAFERAAESRVELVDAPSAYPVLPPVNTGAHLARAVELDNISAGRIRPMGQLHESFIIAVDDEGLLLIDQHVAHERILFDKFRRKETDRTIESQNLLLPETVDLTPAQSQAFELVEDELSSIGFGLMRLSGRTIAIKSIPTDLPAAEVRNLFAEILDNIDLEKRGSGRATVRDDIAASLACKAAVKINMKLTPEKMQWLIDRLLITSSPTTCPHGRPVILRLSMKDIERGFHRS
ncbi:MAG: DNA mismatch repair endonuclease MutL, partial [bacterium]|nr:DNA mismatch repair endonuclease MutL [bacterium]